MTPKEAALQYARADTPVLWVYGIAHDDDTGEWYCTCRQSGSSCNPGKHAPFGGHGVYDATTDLEVIESWPDDCNVAIAGQDTRPIIDIDDPEIVALLLDPEVGLRDIATVSTTGRGLHIYMQCAPTKCGTLKRKDTRQPIGEMRAKGLYVVAPPSMHYSGRRYTWLGNQLLEQGPTMHQSDAWDYIAKLLASVGVELVAKTEATSGPTRRGPIPVQAELPFKTDNATLQSMLEPSYPVTVRHEALFHLACELTREVKTLGLKVDRHLLAGVIKHADLIRKHPEGPKFAHRANADACYWNCLIEAESAVSRERKGAKSTEQDSGSKETDGLPETQGSPYVYQDDPPAFLDNRARRPVQIANFEPLILEHLYTLSGDDVMDEQTGDWGLRIRQGNTVITKRLQDSQIDTAAHFAIAINRASPDYIIEEKMDSRLYVAAKEYSKAYHGGSIPIRYSFGFTGWVPGRNAFLLPGAKGAITADGFDENVRFEAEDIPQRFYQYGWGVSPKDCDLASAMRTLWIVHDPRVMVPLLTQVFSASLASLGTGKNPLMLHIQARTGSFKTSLTRVALSVFGQFTDERGEGTQLEGWDSTMTSLKATMHRTRDLPLAIDDFKLSLFPSKEISKVYDLIQSYADRRERTRSTARLVEQPHRVPRCLAISTGEDIWSHQESVAARTLRIDGSIPDEEKVAFKRRLLAAQEAARTGLLGTIGYEWLRWCAEKGRSWLADQILQRHEKNVLALQNLATIHQRSASSIAMLLAVSTLLGDFVDECVPDFAAEYKHITQVGFGAAMVAAQENAEDAQSFSPFRALIAAMSDGLSTGTGYLAQRLQDSEGVGIQGADVMGFVDHTAIWLNENITLGWYRREQRKQGRDSHIDWNAFLQEAMRDFGAFRPKNPVRVWASDSYLRLISLPRGCLLPEMAEPMAEWIS